MSKNDSLRDTKLPKKFFKTILLHTNLEKEKDWHVIPQLENMNNKLSLKLC